MSASGIVALVVVGVAGLMVLAVAFDSLRRGNRESRS